MVSLSVILGALFGSLCVAVPFRGVPRPLAEGAREWTIDELSRKAHGSNRTCHWKFTLTESITPPNYNETNVVVMCKFKVKAMKHLDCRAGSFGLTQCSHKDADFFVSGGRDKDGFLTLAVSNAYENTQAFFGYLDSALDDGAVIPPQTAQVRNRSLGNPGPKYRPGPNK